jgi:hypothetical protein
MESFEEDDFQDLSGEEINDGFDSEVYIDL